MLTKPFPLSTRATAASLRWLLDFLVQLHPVLRPFSQKYPDMKPSLSPLINPRLSYQSSGRGGTLTYHDHRSTIRFDWEFGGGDCVAIIFVPTPVAWEHQTGRPLAEREQILTFVGEQAVRDQAPSCRFELSDMFIELVRR